MKNIIFALILFTSTFSSLLANSIPETDSTGNPGDNLDLYGVLELFKKSNSPEEFEKALNTESNHVNNLDLNKDGEIDYIRVIDKADSNAHAIILQIPFNDSEAQDVAVIEIENNSKETAHIQIVGDEDLYGENYILEPYENYVGKDEYDAANKKNDSEKSNVKVVVNVWMWPCVRYIYAPVYRPWVSPWYWRHYPGWWKPWRPVWWHVHHRRALHYHPYYRAVTIHRVRVAHRVYHRHHVHSPTVRKTYVVRTPTHRTTVKRTPQKVQKRQPGNRQPSNSGRPKNNGGKRTGGKRR